MPNKVRVGTEVAGARKAATELDQLRDKVDKLGKTGAKGLGVGIGAGLALGAVNALSAGVSIATDAVFDAIKAGSDLNETMSKSAAVFGDNADEVSDWGDTTARTMGIAKNAAVGAAAGFGDLFNKLGLGPAKAKSMSEALVTLSADLASFNNLDPEEVLLKLKSGLAGESEPLRSLGVFLNEAKVKAKAMELGLADVHGELSEGAKVQARYALILEETKSAQGDFARTSDQMANQQRILNAELEDTSAKLGQKLVPAMIGAQRAALGLATTLDVLQEGVAKTTEGQEAQLRGLADWLTALNVVTPLIGSLGPALENEADALGKAAAGYDAVGDNSQNMAEKVHGSAFGNGGVIKSMEAMEEGAEDWRDKYRDVTGDVIRRSNRMVEKLADDAQDVIDDYFDPIEERADLFDTHQALLAAQEAARTAKTKKDKRDAADDIIQALDDEGTSLTELGRKHKLTAKDVDKYERDVKASYKAIGRTVPPQIQKIIDKLRELARIKSVSVGVHINTRQGTGTHAGGGGPQEFAEGGVVQGPKGSPQMILAHAGETVLPTHKSSGGGLGGGSTFNITINAGMGSGLTAGSARALAEEVGPALVTYMQRNGHLTRTGTGLRG